MALSGVAWILDRTVCPMICGSMLASHERVTGMGICDTISFFPQLIAPIIGATLITYFGGMNKTGIIRARIWAAGMVYRGLYEAS